MGVNIVQPTVDFTKIGQRIKAARLEKGLNQSELGELVGCSNNHMSHVEVGQTKVSLSMLMKLSLVLEKDFDYFLMDTPYVRQERLIDTEILKKLKKCTPATLLSVSKIIDVLLEQQYAEAGNGN
ncbi:DNA-binding protein [Flavonifractor sp. An135]|mgnify:CR=1 FL=1|nr:DNA-binding protein [Flavonifractor sp. An135]